MPEKKCSKCGEIKPLSGFGLKSAVCKDCQRVYDQYRYRNADMIKERHAARKAERTALLANGQKRCNACSAIKDISDFPKGTGSVCKGCKLAKKKEKYWDNPEKYRRKARDHHWKNREKRLSDVAKWRHENQDKVKQYKDSYDKEYFAKEHNRERRDERAREWYKQNKERHQASRAIWREKNPEVIRASRQRRKARVKGASGELQGQHLTELIRAQNGLCTYHDLNPNCEKFIFDNYTVDHILPLSRGGTNDPGNIQLLCFHCNCSKSARTHQEYIEWLARVYGGHSR